MYYRIQLTLPYPYSIETQKNTHFNSKKHLKRFSHYPFLSCWSEYLIWLKELKKIVTALIRARLVINQNFAIITTRDRDTSGSTILTSLLQLTLLSSKFYDSNQPLLRHIHNRRVLLLTHIRDVTVFWSWFVFSISNTLSLVLISLTPCSYVTCLWNIHQQNDSELWLRRLCSDSIIQAVYEYKSKWLMIYLPRKVERIKENQLTIPCRRYVPRN